MSLLITPYTSYAYDCDTGYQESDIYEYSFTYTGAGTCAPGYTLYSMDYGLVKPAGQTFEMVKCPLGKRYENGACVNLSQDDCDGGFYNNGTNNLSTFMQSYNGDCINGYDVLLARRNISYVNNVQNVDCPLGKRYENGACVNLSQDDCDSGFYDNGTNNVGTFIQSYNGGCINGYDVLLSRQNVSYVIPTHGLNCKVWERPLNDACVANPTDGCPENYYAMLPDTAFDRRVKTATTNDNDEEITTLECGTDYSLYDDDTTLCHLYIGENTVDYCTPLCEVDYDHTQADTCARKCASENRQTLHAKRSNGAEYAWQLWMDKTTEPALHFKKTDSDDMCYMNLVPGSRNGTINFRNADNDIYHGVDLK